MEDNQEIVEARETIHVTLKTGATIAISSSSLAFEDLYLYALKLIDRAEYTNGRPKTEYVQ